MNTGSAKSISSHNLNVISAIARNRLSATSSRILISFVGAFIAFTLSDRFLIIAATIIGPI